MTNNTPTTTGEGANTCNTQYSGRGAENSGRGGRVIPVAVAAEAVVEAEAEETNLILQRKAVTVDKFNLAA